MAAAAVSVGTYSAWESTATLRLLGDARRGEERGGAYCVATRTACYFRGKWRFHPNLAKIPAGSCHGQLLTSST